MNEDFWTYCRTCLGIGWGTAWRFLGSSPVAALRTLALAVLAALALWFFGPVLSVVGLHYDTEAAPKAVATGVLALLSLLIALVASAVLIAIFHAPFKLWRNEHRKAASYPYGAAIPLFDTLDFATDHVPGPPPYREAITNIELTREVRNAQINVWAYHGAANRKLIETIPLHCAHRGQRFKIILARSEVSDGQGLGQHFGQHEADRFGENEALLVVVEMVAGRLRQEQRFQIMVMYTREVRVLRAWAADWNPYFWPDRR